MPVSSERHSAGVTGVSSFRGVGARGERVWRVLVKAQLAARRAAVRRAVIVLGGAASVAAVSAVLQSPVAPASGAELKVGLADQVSPMMVSALVGTSVERGGQTVVSYSLEEMAGTLLSPPVEAVAKVETRAQTPRVAAPVAAPAKRIKWMEVTAYCACKACCGPGARGITASGKRVSYNRGRFVAADTSVLPFGTRIRVPGYAEGEVVEVIDRGGAIKGNKLDLYFPSHQAALEWGRRWVPVEVVGKR
jgi:3D (Asp-Asp-Asp) domain-containing protein